MIPQATDNLTTILDSTGFWTSATNQLPARDLQAAAAPAGLDARVLGVLEAMCPAGLYSHQSEAIDESLAGKDLCLATATASGKSLVFMAAACDLALRDPDAIVLCLYPVRALVQDQEEKWRAFAGPLGLPVGRIDGSVRVSLRTGILQSSRIVVMTPDVAHAWLLGKASANRGALSRIRMVVLDEAHCYTGAFGTNMAYFLRRLGLLAGNFKYIASTATIGEPEAFLARLAGRSFRVFGHVHDGSPAPAKHIRLCHLKPGHKDFEAKASLVRELGERHAGRFIVFADSRKMVERVAEASYRGDRHGDHGLPDVLPDQGMTRHVLPYRSGYEAQDREEIQKALADGRLRGVVSTSALELGVDIGGIDLVVMLNVPQGMQSFWQRLGRAGRRGEDGQCVIIDTEGVLAVESAALVHWMARPVEENFLYLENRWLQYGNVLCAAAEAQGTGLSIGSWTGKMGVPAGFVEMLANELEPAAPVPDDLYPLKQQAGQSPHHAFPIRTGAEANFQIKLAAGPVPRDLGTVTMAQMVREAYPGAIYFYKAEAFRIQSLGKGEIRAIRSHPGNTRPLSQVTAFPDFNSSRHLRVTDTGFLTECEIQVSERVTGFTEQHGSTSTQHEYGPGSTFAQAPVNRFFRTTGVLWSFDGVAGLSEAAAERILRAFCQEFGIQSRDIGLGRFMSKSSPVGAGECRGLCIYDDVMGGLRLTEKLAREFTRVLPRAAALAGAEGESTLAAELMLLADRCAGLAAPGQPTIPAGLADDDDGWITLVAPGEQAIHHVGGATREVTVTGHFFTPSGIHYRIPHPSGDKIAYSVPKAAIEPLHGVTRSVRYNIHTGEERVA